MRFHTTEFDFLPELAFRPRPGGGMTLEGGKGSSAPPPDPRLIEAQIRSMGIQDSAITAIQEQSRTMTPILREQMNFGLSSARVAFDQSQADRGYALERRGQLTGAQDRQIAEMTSFNEGQRGQELVDSATADIGMQANMGREAMERNLQRKSVNPNSGKMLSLQSSANIQEAAAKAGASAVGRASAKSEGRMLTDRVTSSLQGFPTLGMSTTAAGAQFGTAGLGIAGNGQGFLNAGSGAAANIAGQMGSNATSMFNAQGSYKNQQDQIAGNDPLLGAVGQVAGMWMAGSSHTLKKNFRGMKPGEGLDMIERMPVGGWAYKDDSGYADGGQEHIGPIAENVQQVAGDEVAPGGKAIDLISMNGITMHAVQDLSREIKSIKRLLAAGGMRQQQTEAV